MYHLSLEVIQSCVPCCWYDLFYFLRKTFNVNLVHLLFSFTLQPNSHMTLLLLQTILEPFLTHCISVSIPAPKFLIEHCPGGQNGVDPSGLRPIYKAYNDPHLIRWHLIVDHILIWIGIPFDVLCNLQGGTVKKPFIKASRYRKPTGHWVKPEEASNTCLLPKRNPGLEMSLCR